MIDNQLEFPLMVLFTLLALVFVLVLAWFAIRFLATINRANPKGARPVKILHTTAIGSRERLVLIQYQGQDILLGVSAGGISVIDSRPKSNDMDTQ